MRVLELPDSKLRMVYTLRHRTYGKGKRARRGTEVKLLIVNDKAVDVLHADALCHPNDNFSRREGRKQAASNLLQKVKSSNTIATKRDRALLFNAICPEYGLAAKYHPK